MLVGGVADCTVRFVDGELPLVFKQLLGLDADRRVIGLAAFESERCQPFGVRELHVWDFGAEALELVVAFPAHFLLLSVMVSVVGWPTLDAMTPIPTVGTWKAIPGNTFRRFRASIVPTRTRCGRMRMGGVDVDCP